MHCRNAATIPAVPPERVHNSVWSRPNAAPAMTEALDTEVAGFNWTKSPTDSLDAGEACRHSEAA
jgi:hypothetical protein